MGSTNKTTNIDLSQFLGSDSPKWLTDYNADMQKIDTFAGAIQAQADATDIVVSGHTSAIETLQDESSDYNIAIQQLRTDVDGNTGSINTINSLIGNGEPTTTDKTLIGAINELNETVEEIESKIVFKEYHSTSAITSEAGDTLNDLASDILTTINDKISHLQDDEKLIIDNIQFTGLFGFTRLTTHEYTNLDTITYWNGCAVSLSASTIALLSISLGTNSEYGVTRTSFADSSVSSTKHVGTDSLTTMNISGATIVYSIVKTI